MSAPETTPFQGSRSENTHMETQANITEGPEQQESPNNDARKYQWFRRGTEVQQELQQLLQVFVQPRSGRV